MLAMMRSTTPVLLRSGTRGLMLSPPVAPAARRLRTLTRFREEERPDAEKHQKQPKQQYGTPSQQAAQQAAQQAMQEQDVQMQKEQRERLTRGEGQQGGQEGQMTRSMPGGLMGPDMMLPPSFRRFNETLAQVQREMDMVMNQILGDDMLRPFAPMERSLGMPGALSPLPSPMELARGMAMPALIHMEFDESDKEYTLSAEVPGFSKDQVKAILSPDGILTIQGELKEDEDQGEGSRRMTRFSTFTRSFRLPSDANADGIKACVKDGVMRVCVPKMEKKEQPHREIPVN